MKYISGTCVLFNTEERCCHHRRIALRSARGQRINVPPCIHGSMVTIVYSTQGGSSRRYAGWLSERLNAPCYQTGSVPEDVDDDIVFVGWRSGPAVVGLNDVPRRDRVIAVICVGLERYDEKAMENIRKKNSVDELFYVRGAMDRKTLRFGQKLLLAAVSIKMRLFNRSPEDRRVREVMDRGGDLSSEDQLDGFVVWFGNR